MYMEQTAQITYLFITILISQYVYLRVLNLERPRAVIIALGVLLSGLLSCSVFMLREPLPHARFILIILAISVFTVAVSDRKPNLSIVASVISVGISYGFNLIAVVISALFMYLAMHSVSAAINTFISIPIQCILVFLVFKVRRLSKGILFLEQKGAGAVGVLISCALLLAIILIVNTSIPAEIGLWLLVVVVLCTAMLITWWRRGLTRLYIGMIRERNVNEYLKSLAEKDTQIQKLQEYNRKMADVIHSDHRKLPAALSDAVQMLIESGLASGTGGDNMQNWLRERLEEHAGINQIDQHGKITFPSMKDTYSNGVMDHMLEIASVERIRFEIAAVGSINDLIDTGISAMNVEVLCANLIDNAINATSSSDLKRVLITFGFNMDAYEISLQDSGVPFKAKTLLSLGSTWASPHLYEVDTCAGFVTVFKTLRKHKASLVIMEYEPRQSGFSKSVTVRFDKKDQYIVKTHRADEINAYRAASNMQGDMPLILNS